jgi:phage baseplate assembly protein W
VRHDLDFPLHVDARGHTAQTDVAGHVRDLVHQVLFTTPGERVMRPDFGCGLRTLVFMPNSDALATATQALVKSALQRWLEREIQVESVEVRAEHERLHVEVAYVSRLSGERRVERFDGAGGQP